MYGASEDGDLVELRETGFAKEVDLQDFLTKHPALLAGDQMPRRPLQTVPGVATSKCTSPSVVKLIVA